MFKRRGRPGPWGAGKMPYGSTVGVFLFFLIAQALALAPNAAAGLTDHAVINEIGIDSLVGTGGTEDDWLELYNPTTQAVDLTGWSVQKTAGSGSSLVKVALSGSLAAGDYFLIVRDNAATSQALKDAANILVSDAFSLAQNNIVYLVNDNENITGADDPNIVDFVGFGTALFFEGSTAAPAIPEAKSIARLPSGEDTNQSSIDWQVQDSPTPTGAAAAGNDIGGTVLLTITPDAFPVQGLGANEAQIVFQINTNGSAQVKYGLDVSYASSTPLAAVTANNTTGVSLIGLACDTSYHYVIYAENAGATETDVTADAVFSTLPCGITLDSLLMTKSSAKANNQYADGWQWEFDLTVWNMNEATLKMKFNQWSGAANLAAAGNMQFSVDNGTVWHEITADNAYPASGAAINGIDNDAAVGRQITVIVRMKVPVGTLAGYYNSSYGILTE